jgi:ribosome biogenesis GTPase
VVAGDRVVVEGDNVQAVAPRVRVLKRAVRQRDQVLAAHVDRLVVVVAAGPALRQGFVMRSVVVGALQGLPCTVVVNKVDMDRDGEAGRTVAAWQALGLHVLATSAATGEGVESLRDLVATGLTVFMGQSGVGKSSLINLLRPFARLRTGGLDREGMGRHTTTLALGILSHGSLLVDLPGIRELGLSGATPESVLCAFPDVAAAIPRCRFPACAHRGDAGCAVEEEVRAGRLDAARVELCLRMQESVAGGMEGGGRV